jgi:hypothetical protein
VRGAGERLVEGVGGCCLGADGGCDRDDFGCDVVEGAVGYGGRARGDGVGG